jgi:hypothetical protein
MAVEDQGVAEGEFCGFGELRESGGCGGEQGIHDSAFVGDPQRNEGVGTTQGEVEVGGHASSPFLLTADGTSRTAPVIAAVVLYHAGTAIRTAEDSPAKSIGAAQGELAHHPTIVS